MSPARSAARPTASPRASASSPSACSTAAAAGPLGRDRRHRLGHGQPPGRPARGRQHEPGRRRPAPRSTPPCTTRSPTASATRSRPGTATRWASPRTRATPRRPASPRRSPSARPTRTTRKASFSNYGTCVDWFAPGVSITSAWYNSNTATNTISGTSMATPHTAGVAALYLQGNPGASASSVRTALYNLTTKGVVTSSKTTNNHLLFTNFSRCPATSGAGRRARPRSRLRWGDRSVSSFARGMTSRRRSTGRPGRLPGVGGTKVHPPVGARLHSKSVDRCFFSRHYSSVRDRTAAATGEGRRMRALVVTS